LIHGPGLSLDARVTLPLGHEWSAVALGEIGSGVRVGPPGPRLLPTGRAALALVLPVGFEVGFGVQQLGPASTGVFTLGMVGI
jgi:hypothetical protein